MSHLQRVAKQYVEGLSKGGGRGQNPVDTDSSSREQLRSDLQRGSKQSGLWFLICFAGALGLFALTVWIAATFRDEPSKFGAWSAATGLALMGTLAAMTALWKQKVRADLLFALASELNEDGIRAVFEVLLKDL